MKPTAPTALGRFAAFVGLDWADGNHAVCLQTADSERREVSELEHRPESIDAWARGLRRRFGGKPIAVALELERRRTDGVWTQRADGPLNQLVNWLGQMRRYRDAERVLRPEIESLVRSIERHMLDDGQSPADIDAMLQDGRINP